KWDPNREDGLFHRQSCILYCFYHWTQIEIHKKFIPQSNEPSMLKLPSLAICANASQSVIRVLEVIERLNFEILPNFTAPVHVAAIVLLMNIWRNKYCVIPQDTSKDMNDVRHSLKATADYEKKYPIAGMIKLESDALSSMIYMVELYFVEQSSFRAIPGSMSAGSASTLDDVLKVLIDNNGPTTSSSHPMFSNLGVIAENPLQVYHSSIHPPTTVGSQTITTAEQTYSSDFSDYFASTAVHHQMEVVSGYLTGYSQMNVPSFGTDIPEEDWTTFMADVDKVLLAVDSRGID
ncbi:hypothetical protein GG344DRAFT_71622, partial [Lentinula edodes]